MRTAWRTLQFCLVIASVFSMLIFPRYVTEHNVVWVLIGWGALIGAANVAAYTQGLLDGRSSDSRQIKVPWAHDPNWQEKALSAGWRPVVEGWKKDAEAAGWAWRPPLQVPPTPPTPADMRLGPYGMQVSKTPRPPAKNPDKDEQPCSNESH